MLKRTVQKWIAIGLVAVSGSVFAWGPETQRSVVTSAGHVFSRNSKIPLTNLIKYVHEGAQISGEEEDALYLQFQVDPIRTVQREMFLLQGIKSNRVDPYFAYRLGALGKKIVEMSAPLQSGNAAVREQYYADADANINKTQLKGSKRNLVEPQLYFPRLVRLSQENNQAIIVDYRAGMGFSGIGGKLLAIDASRAVDAVADVWFTIFRAQVDFVDISRSDMRKYMLSAIEFYLKKNNIAEVNDVYVRAKEKYILTPEMKQTIGDLYYDNEFFEEALMVYGELLEDDPGIREVKKRIAEYYVRVGEEALVEDELETAQEAFAIAVESDKLHPEAQRQLVMANRAIEKRDARHVHTRELIELAQQGEMDAEDAEIRRDYARSIQYLKTSEGYYGQVTEEFADLAKAAKIGLRSVRIQLNDMKRALVNNAQLLSGSGFAYDARKLSVGVGDTREAAMKAALKAEYKQALEALPREIEQP